MDPEPEITNVHPLNYPYLMASDLNDRGWTETMIKRFLGEEDRRLSVDHWANFAGARAWQIDRVERAECTAAFEEYFRKSARRRKLSTAVEKDVLRRIQKLRKDAHDLQ